MWGSASSVEPHASSKGSNSLVPRNNLEEYTNVKEAVNRANRMLQSSCIYLALLSIPETTNEIKNIVHQTGCRLVTRGLHLSPSKQDYEAQHATEAASMLSSKHAIR